MATNEDKITVRQHDQTKSTTRPAAAPDYGAAAPPLLGGLLLSNDDPPPVTRRAGGADSPFVLVLDHAGRAIPRSLGDLGLACADRIRHIAWDIGVAETGVLLGEALDAAIVAQSYSRLVIDCNRRPGHATSIAEASDRTQVPRNIGLTPAAQDARVQQIFIPYQDAIASLLDQRQAAGVPSVLVALHSFTPRLLSAQRPAGADRSGNRPWHAGVLYNHDPRLSLILRDLLQAEGDLVVGDNEPYALSDLDDYTVPVHGEQRGLPHVEIEVRQDLIAEPAGQAAWAARLARLLHQAWATYCERFPCR